MNQITTRYITENGACYEQYVITDPEEKTALTITPERGGMITGFTLDGDEYIWTRRPNFSECSRPRFGVPVLFPNCGGPDGGVHYFDGKAYPMENHGLADLCAWDVESVGPDGAAFCPLDIKHDRKRRTTTVAPVWVPAPEHKRIHYRRWVEEVCAHGYRFEHRVLNAADFGAYTSRVRYFGQFARPDLPMAWPRQTHARNPEQTRDLFTEPLAPWRPVRECLDFEDRGESIFDRRRQLVGATLDRIHAGLVKFVAGGKDAFLVKYNSRNQSGKYIAPGLDAPCPTVATQNRLGVARVDFLFKQFSGQPAGKNIPIDGPAGTVTTIDHHAFVSAYYGNGYNSPVERPAPTLTTKDRFQLVQPFITNYYSGGGQLSGVDEQIGRASCRERV